MEREIYSYLLRWKSSPERKPLMMYGARQVGKTYILKEFGRREFETLAYVNCYRNEAVRGLFAGDSDVRRLCLGLSAIAGCPIEPGRTLLFLDEIQEAPGAVASLKYFCEDIRGLHVVAAGSLLGVSMLRGESFPVGKLDTCKLYPMTYREFLRAVGRGQLADILAGGDRALADALAEQYTELLRQYYFVGGMPEAVVRFAARGDIGEVRTVQRELLSAYEADMAKHSGAALQRIRMVWQSIPSQLARENKRFVFGSLRQGARAKDFETAIEWLVEAGLIYKVERVRETRLPLRFYADASAFKLYALDVGLLGAMSDTPPSAMLIGASVFAEYKGAFTENYVLQQMVASGVQPVFYYSKLNSTMEIDFIVQAGERVLPIEVKAEENVKSKSLRAFVEQAGGGVRGLRFSMLPFREQDWMDNVPLYAAAGCL